MDSIVSIIVLVVAVTCVMVATQPVRPPSRRRLQPAASAPAASKPAPESTRASDRWGDTQRWSRRDIQQAVARDHAFPGGESVWPPR